MKFFLGTHRPYWLGYEALAGIPLFVSHRTLGPRKSLPRAVSSWSLDSGGFTEIGKYGKWMTPAVEYVEAVTRYRDEIGLLDWAAPQDWMCEDVMLAKTGLTVRHHQELTIQSVLELRSMAPHLPFIPVLQGREVADYVAHAEMYSNAGLDLRGERVVGVGSVCRRQATEEIGALFRELSSEGLALHGFGVKKLGLLRYGQHLTSADSMAWSYGARKNPPLPQCTHRGNCANCLDYALAWREKVSALV